MKKPKQLPDTSVRGSTAPVDVEPTLGEQLAQLIGQAGDGGHRVRVDRRNARGAPEYLGTEDLTLELEDVVKGKWGGGDYRGRIVNAQGVYQDSIRFSIAGAPRDVADVNHAPVPRAAESATDVLLRAVLDTQKQMADVLREISRAAHAPAGGANSVTEVVGMVGTIAKALKDATGDGAPRSSTSDTLAIVDRVLGLREKILETSDAPASSDIGMVVRDGVRPLLELGSQYLTTQREVQMARLRLTPGAPADPVALLANRIPALARAMLVSKAAGNADPELYAEFALDQLTDVDQDALKGLLEEADFVDRLCVAVPTFAPHREWFVGFAAAMRTLLSSDGEEDGGNGGGVDTAGNGSHGSASTDVREYPTHPLVRGAVKTRSRKAAGS